MNQPLIHHVHNSSNNNNNNNKSPTTMTTTTQEPLTAFFNFHKVLETTSSRDCFREFLTQLHSVEQLDFLDQVLMLKQMELYNHHEQPYKNEEEKEQLEEKCALDLLNTFVRTGSPKEVNIDREMRLCCEDMVMRLRREKMEQRKNCKNQNRENAGDENMNAGDEKGGMMMMMEMRHFHCAFREIEFQIFYQLKTDMFDMFLQSSLFEMFIGRLALEKSPNLLSLHLPSCSGNDNSNESNNSKGKNRSNALRHSISYTNMSSSATNMNGSGGSERNGSSSSNGLLRRSLRRNITSLMSNGNGDSNGDVSSSTSDQSGNNLVTSLMKRVKTRRQSQQETIEELYHAQQVMIEQMNRTIKDLYAKMVEKEREIHVLRNQLQQHRIVPHGLEYYHNTSGTSGSIRPISPHLLPPPASSPPLLSSSSSKRFISSQNSRILDGDDNGDGNNGGAGGSGQATRSSSTSGPESPLQVRPKVFAVRPPANRKISNPESVRPNSTEPNTSPNKQHNNL